MLSARQHASAMVALPDSAPWRLRTAHTRMVSSTFARHVGRHRISDRCCRQFTSAVRPRLLHGKASHPNVHRTSIVKLCLSHARSAHRPRLRCMSAGHQHAPMCFQHAPFCYGVNAAAFLALSPPFCHGVNAAAFLTSSPPFCHGVNVAAFLASLPSFLPDSIFPGCHMASTWWPLGLQRVWCGRPGGRVGVPPNIQRHV